MAIDPFPAFASKRNFTFMDPASVHTERSNMHKVAFSVEKGSVFTYLFTWP